MRILQITYDLTSGGGQRLTVDLCNELVKNPSDEVAILILNSKKDDVNLHYLNDLDKRVKVYFSGTNSPLSFKAQLSIFRTIKDFKADVVHAQICDNVLLFLPALLKSGVKFVSTFHSTVARTVRFRNLKPVYRWMFGHKKIIPCTISEICRQSFVDFFCENTSQLIINGRSPVSPSVSFPQVKDEIESYKISPNDLIFLYIGRVHPVKNPEMLYDTFSRLEAKNKDFQLIVVGDGHLQNYSNRQSKRIHIVGEKNNVGDYLACADYLTLTSHVEGLPIVLLEAMSCGVVPVCTPAGGVVDVIRNGENGFLSKDTEDADDYYHTVSTAIESYGKIQKEGLIREYIEKYSMEKCAKSYRGLYSEN